MDVVILGAGGHGKVVLDILRAQRQHHVVGFLDADPALAGSKVAGVEVLGAVNLLSRLKQQRVRGAIVAIGDNRTRRRYADEVLACGLELVSAIHPSAVVASGATIDAGVVVAAGAVVGVDATIARDAIINTGALIDHECVIGPAAHICPGVALAGRVEVGAEAFIGIGSRVIQCVKIGAAALVAAGAVVIRDIPDAARVAGVPARLMA
jgi:sugar O-acyltransferase (sialic acid O-acetyltransferase NeuD family)